MSSTERQLDVAIICYAVLAAMVSTTSADVALRGIVVTPLLLFATGYSVLRATNGAMPLNLQTIVFSVALSIAICVLTGVVLNTFDTLSVLGWTASLGLLTAGVSTLSLIRCARPARKKTFGSLPNLRLAHWAMFGAAASISVVSVGLARSGAMAQREYAFTQFWMVPDMASSGNLVTIGIRNEEQISTNFEVAIFADGAGVSRQSGIALAPGETWSNVVPLSGKMSRADRVEAWLFKAHAPNNVYRKVWLSNTSDLLHHNKDNR